MIINLNKQIIIRRTIKTIKTIESNIEQLHLKILSTEITAESLIRIGELGEAIRYAEKEIKELRDYK